MFSGSIVALVTPFDEHEQIDFAQVASLIDWHISQGTSAIVIAGTTGESATLTDDEIVELARFSAIHSAKYSAKYGDKRIAIVAGNGTNCTRRSVALTKQLNSTGIDALLTVTPYYNKPSADGLLAHYQAINDASRLPILLYNVPSRTGCDLSVSLVAKLAELSRVCGIKDATAELTRVAQYRQLCDEHFILLSGDDESAIEFCKLGGDGVISVTANLVPSVMAQIQQFIKEEKYQAAELLNQQLAQLHKNLFVESNPIPVKWAMQTIKRLPNAKMRLPLCPLSSTGQQLLSVTLTDLTQHFQEY